MPEVTGASQADRDAAAAIAAALPSTPLAQRYYLQLVARAETFYGRWKNAGAGSNNWGALQVGDLAAWKAAGRPYFQTADHHEDGTEYLGAFRAYATPAEGIRDMARTLLKPNVVAAIMAGRTTDAVRAQRANGYFELPLDRYIAALAKNDPPVRAALTSGTAGPAVRDDASPRPSPTRFAIIRGLGGVNSDPMWLDGGRIMAPEKAFELMAALGARYYARLLPTGLWSPWVMLVD